MLKVKLTLIDDATYYIKGQIVDATDGKHIGQDVLFRDMSNVRCYYNGWTAALRMAGITRVTLYIVGWPHETRQFDVPLEMEYIYPQ